MPELSSTQEAALRAISGDVEALRQRVHVLSVETAYEDLEHGEMGLEIVHHAVEEVLEHGGLGGSIAHEPDPGAHAQAVACLDAVRQVLNSAGGLQRTHPNEDLETAIRALTIASGSLEEVVERYE